MSDWIEWNGGEQPVADDVMVEVRFRNEKEVDADPAGIYRWNHAGTTSDIIAYRVIGSSPAEREAEPVAEVTFVAVNPQTDGRYYFAGQSDERMSVGAELFTRPASPCQRCKELGNVLREFASLEVKNHALIDRLQFSTEGRALRDKIISLIGE